jgi:hypothetical protein
LIERLDLDKLDFDFDKFERDKFEFVAARLLGGLPVFSSRAFDSTGGSALTGDGGKGIQAELKVLTC